MRAPTHTCEWARPATTLAGLLVLATLIAPSAATADNGGAGLPPSPEQPPILAAPGPGTVAKLSSDGRTAIAPAAAPVPVQQAIIAANEITRKPYVYGGGHDRFRARGYDCSGAVSYVLHGAELLSNPLGSSDLLGWGEAGRGTWITVYANAGHAYMLVAGLRFDTSGRGESGPRWRVGARSGRRLRARHPEGL